MSYTVELIRKKRDGQRLTKAELDQLLQGYVKNEIPDYQMAAWAMAVYFQGMDEQETADLTQVIVDTGETLDLSAISGTIVDKHSTGGVGDKTTLILGPLVASVGVPVAKLSGRGLGHTGGTIDKLEAIPGFSTSLSKERFINLVNQTKIAVAGQTANLTPGDKLLYALRDVTATVESLPLIASSIMSKKIAASTQAIVLDVKTGSGAFMREEQQAIELAQAMVNIGKRLERQTVAVISDMNQPLGFAIGNALEVQEAIEVLRGAGPDDLRELSLVLGAEMVRLSGVVEKHNEARDLLERSIADGKALETCKQWIENQGGVAAIVDEPQLLPQARYKEVVPCSSSGWIGSMDTEKIGLCAMKLGAGRAVKEDQIDPAVGLQLHAKLGEEVQEGKPLFTLYANDQERLDKVKVELVKTVSIVRERVNKPKLIKMMID